MRVATNRYGGYDAIIEGVDPATKRRRRVIRSGRTKKEAKARAEEYLQQVRTGVGKATGTVSVGQYLHSWLQIRKPDLAPNTWRAYDQHLRLYVVPVLGQIRLCDLTAPDIRAMLANLEKAQRTRHHALMTLHAALQTAVDDKLIVNNPAGRLKMSKGRSRTASLTAEQGARLLAACEAEDSVYADAVALALLTGMRHGEVLGLRWSDVGGYGSAPAASPIRTRPTDGAVHAGPHGPSTITISQALQRVTGQGMVERPPKTRAGERTIALGPRAAAILSRAKGRQKVVSIHGRGDVVGHVGRHILIGDRVGSPAPGEPITAGSNPAHGLLVFPGLRETALRRHFKILLCRAECPDVRFHDLRHTVGTLMRGHADTRAIADHLGHADPSITARVYQHMRTDLNAEAVLSYEALFGQQKREEEAG